MGVFGIVRHSKERRIGEMKNREEEE